jgi:hypothetical protein
VCPHTTIHASACCYVCVLMLLYVSSYYYMCPHTAMCPHATMCPHTTVCVSAYYYYMCPHTTMCPHSTMCVSSYYYVCVLILLYDLETLTLNPKP